VTVHGEVADADAFMTAHDVLVVPLLSGSGIRIKILEAMALGIPVIATTAGISGIDAQPGEEVIVANDPVSWQQLAVHMKNEQDWLRQIGENGRKRLEMSYNPQALTAQLEAFLLNLPS
jgi:glycosyltransferase involved in cell wall biosynthesis